MLRLLTGLSKSGIKINEKKKNDYFLLLDECQISKLSKQQDKINQVMCNISRSYVYEL